MLYKTVTTFLVKVSVALSNTVHIWFNFKCKNQCSIFAVT